MRRVRVVTSAAFLWAVSGAGPSSPEPIDLSPEVADLGTVMVGDSSDLTVTATNVEDQPVVIEGVRFDPGHGALSLLADACIGSELDAGGSCTLTIRFHPTTEVSIVTELIVTTDQGSAAIPVSGSTETGAAAAPPDTFPVDELDPTTDAPPGDGAEPTGSEPEAGDETTGTEPELEGAEPGSGAPPATIDPSDARTEADSRATESNEPDIRACEQRIRRFGLSGAFVPEITMTQGTTETVGLALAVRGTPIPDPPGTSASPTTVVTFESDGCVVTAELVGNGFEIAPAGLIEQSFISRDHLEWSWQVTPSLPGNLDLQAQITPWLVRADGSRHAGAASTYYADISVTARPKPDRSLAYRLNEIVGSPVGGTVVGVLIAGFSATGVVNAVKKRRTSRDQSDTTKDSPETR